MKNYSKQREEIVEVIKDLYTHPTAEEIYMIVKGKDPMVSRSTVYRNLGLLVDNDIIIKITSASGPDRYDYKREAHNHVICTKCGKVYDYNHNFNLSKIKKEIKENTGVEISENGLLFEGVCEECRRK